MTRKTWGPFSGSHLTVMLTAAILAIVPGALWAVDPFQNVAIQDPVSGHKAYVDAGRRLVTYDWVGSADETPANFVRFDRFGLFQASAPCVRIARPPTGKALIVKTLVVNTFNNPTPGGGQNVTFYLGNICGGPVMRVNPGGIGTTALPLEPGFVVPAGLSLMASLSGSVAADVYGTGYLVPASWAPPSSPVAAGAPSADLQQVQPSR